QVDQPGIREANQREQLVARVPGPHSATLHAELALAEALLPLDLPTRPVHLHDPPTLSRRAHRLGGEQPPGLATASVWHMGLLPFYSAPPFPWPCRSSCEVSAAIARSNGPLTPTCA